MSELPIIAVTGTKGKTTVVSLVAEVLQRYVDRVLHVDTSGSFINGIRQSSSEDSLRLWGIRTVTASPGRYIATLASPSKNDAAVAVLESSFSTTTYGVGYSRHKVGAFLNVFSDHVNPMGSIKTREELAEAKSFVFKHIEDNGYAVFNADDELVCGKLERIPSGTVQLLPCGIDFRYFDINKHLRTGGHALTIEDNKVILRSKSERRTLVDLSDRKWPYDGSSKALALNQMYAAAVLSAYFDMDLPESIERVLADARLDESTGRLISYSAENQSMVLCDFAHEVQSLKALAELARPKVKAGGRLRIVIRLSHERPDADIIETGSRVGELYDEVIVYDKIDGHWRRPRPPFKTIYPQEVGRVSKLLARGVEKSNPNVFRHIREDDAIRIAAKRSNPADVTVVIVNDDIARSLSFVKESFGIVSEP